MSFRRAESPYGPIQWGAVSLTVNSPGSRKVSTGQTMMSPHHTLNMELKQAAEAMNNCCQKVNIIWKSEMRVFRTRGEEESVKLATSRCLTQFQPSQISQCKKDVNVLIMGRAPPSGHVAKLSSTFFFMEVELAHTLQASTN